MLQSLLKSKGVTQAELARKLGISPTSVWRLLKMHQLPQNGRAAVLENCATPCAPWAFPMTISAGQWPP